MAKAPPAAKVEPRPATPARPWPGAAIELVPEIVMVGIAVYLLRLTRDFRFVAQPGQPGPTLWPTFVVGGFGACAVLRLVQKLVGRGRRRPNLAVMGQVDGAVPIQMWRLAGGVVLAIGYGAGAIVVGYPLATAVVLAAFVWFGGGGRWLAVLLGPGTALASSWLFIKVVYVSLPTGLGVFDRLTVQLYQLLGIY
ncbi:MAG: tripartite tricarboxylate transporter TctB family protein [Egibacteraceae bacterium]